jgi:hypothetical protein
MPMPGFRDDPLFYTYAGSRIGSFLVILTLLVVRFDDRTTAAYALGCVVAGYGYAMIRNGEPRKFIIIARSRLGAAGWALPLIGPVWCIAYALGAAEGRNRDWICLVTAFGFGDAVADLMRRGGD